MYICTVNSIEHFMIKQLTFNHFGVNCYIVVNEESRQCAIVDPAMEASYEDAQLEQYLASQGLTPTLLLLTHAHVDHICGLRHCCQRFHLPVTMHRDGRKLLRQAETYGSIMDFNVENMSDLDVNEINDGDIIEIASPNSQHSTAIECRHVPGHCPGSLCFIIPSEEAVITGDALFQGSIGRTDLPGGNHQELLKNLREKVLTLPENYLVLPGHGPHTTIADEKNYNPFF